MYIKEKLTIFLDGIDKLISERKYITAEKYLKEYIEKNGVTDYPIIRKLGHVLLKNGKPEEAIEVLEPLLNISGENRDRAIYALAFAYIDLCNYEKSLEYIELYMKSARNINEKHLTNLKSLKASIQQHLKFKLDQEIFGVPKDYHYSEIKTLEHIETNHSYTTHCDEKSYFSEKIDIPTLFYRIKEEINTQPNLKYISERTIRIYCFYYNMIGYTRDNKIKHILIVITDIYSNIITMFPADYEIDGSNINDLNIKQIDDVKDFQKINVRKSQIEKFNQKYGIKN